MPNGPTKKERRDAARSARHEAQARAAKARVRKRITSGLVAVGAVVLIFAWVQMQGANSRKASAGLNTLATGIGCTELQSLASMGAKHIGETDAAQYDRLPPDSGDHFGGGSSNTGVLADSPRNELLAHNMEHGHAGLMYRQDLDPALVASLHAVANDNNLWSLSAPYAQMPEGIDVALTSWRHRIECSDLEAADAPALKDLATKFVDQRKQQGPEKIPGTPVGA